MRSMSVTAGMRQVLYMAAILAPVLVAVALTTTQSVTDLVEVDVSLDPDTDHHRAVCPVLHPEHHL
jgi:hypothetical protein